MGAAALTQEGDGLVEIPGLLVGALEVSASKTSATATMRPSSGIASPGALPDSPSRQIFVVRQCDLRTCLQHRRTAAVQQFVAKLGVVLHDLELFMRQLARLEQDVIGIPILPTSCIGAACSRSSCSASDMPSWRATSAE